MTAATTDLLARTFNSANPNVARVTTPRSIEGDTLNCDNLAGWPDDTVVHFITYKLDTGNDVIPGSQTDWLGLVSGNNIGTLTRVTGAEDGGHSNGDVVEMTATAKWADNLVRAVLSHSNQNGTLKDGAVTTSVITDAAVTTAKIGSLAVSTEKIANEGVTKAKLEKPHYNMQFFANGALGQVVTNTQIPVNWSASDTTNSAGITATGGASGYMTIAREGLYDVNLQVVIIDVDTNGFITWFFYSFDGGSTWVSDRHIPRNISNGQAISSQAQVWLPAGARVQAQVFSSSGPTRIGGGTNQAQAMSAGTHFSIAERR